MTSQPTIPAGSRWQHVKRGTEYEVIGNAELQMATDMLVDGSALVVYRGDDGKLWAREEGEFTDGRFIATPRPPEPTGDTRDRVAQICYVPSRVALGSWQDALPFSQAHPRSTTGKNVREAFQRADAILAALPPARDAEGGELERLREAVSTVANDYQSSVDHHPDHVLIRTVDFANLCVAANIIPHSPSGIVETRVQAIRDRRTATPSAPEVQTGWREREIIRLTRVLCHEQYDANASDDSTISKLAEALQDYDAGNVA